MPNLQAASGSSQKDERPSYFSTLLFFLFSLLVLQSSTRLLTDSNWQTIPMIRHVYDAEERARNVSSLQREGRENTTMADLIVSMGTNMRMTT